MIPGQGTKTLCAAWPINKREQYVIRSGFFFFFFFKVSSDALSPVFKDYFFMWTILKVFVEFVTILLLSYVGGFWP